MSGARADLVKTLDELAQIANVEHEATLDSLQSAVTHAIRCGQALIEARAQVPHGQWGSWIDGHLRMGEANVRVYMRLAEYRELVRGAPSIRDARRIVGALGAGGWGGTGGNTPKVKPGQPLAMSEELTRDARRLRKQGLTYKKIGELLGISTNTVHYRIDGITRKRNLAYSKRRKAESRRARQALERERRDRAVKSAGGKPAEAYALLRRCVLQLDAALGDSMDIDQKAALRSALSYAHRAEDDIVRALRVERTIRALPVV